MMSKAIKTTQRYKQGIEKITVTDATFAQSSECVIEPTWINFFYGNNGSGKTTISRTIRDGVQSGTGLAWSDGEQPGSYVPVVYNQDFVRNELQFTEGNDPILPGVLMLGTEDIEKQRKVEKLTADAVGLDAEIDQTKKKMGDNASADTKNKAEFQKACEKAGKRYKAILGGGGDFRSWDKCVARVRVTTGVSREFDDLSRQHAIAFDPNIREYRPFTKLGFSRIQVAKGYELLDTPIVSSGNPTFVAAVKRLGERAFDWFADGHKYFEPHADGKCPYCQQSLKSPLKDVQREIAACFDSAYQDAVDLLVRFRADYINDVNGFIGVLDGNLQLDLLPKFDITEYRDKVAVFRKTIEINIQHIADKIKEPSSVVVVEDTQALREELNAIIDRYNEQVTANNDIHKVYPQKQKDCERMFWELLAFELSEEKTAYLDEEAHIVGVSKTLSDTLDTQRKARVALQSDIDRKTADLGASTKATAIIVNGLLAKSGFRGFSLKPHRTVPDRFCVCRDNSTEPAENLSEGERNFIAFIYFYHLTRGGWHQKDIKKNKIVVIDDPVSSMDSGVLFIVGSLVRELIEDCFCDGKERNIKQIFVLTHNPYFHKAVSHKYETNQEELIQKSAFYSVKKSESNISTVRICEEETTANEIDILNVSPVKNSYDALWCEYRDAQLPTTLLSVIRRIIEYHFLQLCSYGIDHLRITVKKFIGDSEREQKLADEMLRYIYDDLHDLGDGIYFTPDSETTDYKMVFGKIFDAMGQEAHYKKMSAETNE
ncbi:hypothetical protein FACS1894132_10290 [Clostridia bacterium]|nr:hypothetical protein FACS1894132_10290 [Clostridia bacterium]